MTDPNDSDGSWEFVDKDSDSDTSSVASPYDTGLPEETPAQGLNDDEVEGAWMNNEEFITDSDIEACAEETADSEPDETAPVKAADAEISSAKPEEEPDVTEGNNEEGEKDHPPAEGLTRSMLSYDEEAPATPEVKETEAVDPDVMREDPQNDVQVSPESVEEDGTSMTESSTADDTSAQEVEEEEANDKQERTDDVLKLFENATVAADEPEEAGSADENGSVVSEFERLEPASPESLEVLSVSSSDECIGSADAEKGVEVPSALETPSHADSESGSDAGSGDYTVISAPSNPPVEILSQETETSYVAQDGAAAPSAEEGSVDQAMPANQDEVGVATDPVLPYQRTVGMVTDHMTPPNHRMMISLIMISLGVGYMLGRYPLQHTPTLLQTMPDQAKIKEPPGDPNIQFIYHGHKQPLWEDNLMQPHFEETLKAMQEKQDALKTQLLDERSKVKLRTRGLRMTIQQLKEENNRALLENMKRSKDLESSSLAFNLLKQSCRKQERLYGMEAAVKDKEIQQLKTRLSTMERDASFMNQTVVLYKRLQEQHEKLMTLYKVAAGQQKHKDAQNAERQLFLISNIRRCRREIRNLHSLLRRSEFQNMMYQQAVLQYESERSVQAAAAQHTHGPDSPLMQALAEQGQTCPSDAKHLTQSKRLRARVRVLRFKLHKLAEDSKLNAQAMETLYRRTGDLTNNVMCLQQQLRVQPQDRAADPISFCGSYITPTSNHHHSSPDRASPLSSPQCGLQVNGTLAFDLMTFNLTVKLDNQQSSDYKLQVFKPLLTRDVFFNATCIYKDFIAKRDQKRTPPNPSCQHYEAPIFLTEGTSLPPISAAFTPYPDPLFPAVFYQHAEAKSARVRYQIGKQRADVWKMHKECKAKERALFVSKKEARSARTDLIVAEQKLTSLKNEKNNLTRQLANVTQELLKKQSLKQCLRTALDTDALMSQINGTKTYKSAQKMAQKVKRATNKAWNKMKKFMNKFRSNGSPHESHERGNHRDVHRAHEGRRERKMQQSRKSHDREENRHLRQKYTTIRKENRKSQKNKAKAPQLHPKYHQMKSQREKKRNHENKKEEPTSPARYDRKNRNIDRPRKQNEHTTRGRKEQRKYEHEARKYETPTRNHAEEGPRQQKQGADMRQHKKEWNKNEHRRHTKNHPQPRKNKDAHHQEKECSRKEHERHSKNQPHPQTGDMHQQRKECSRKEHERDSKSKQHPQTEDSQQRRKEHSKKEHERYLRPRKSSKFEEKSHEKRQGKYESKKQHQKPKSEHPPESGRKRFQAKTQKRYNRAGRKFGKRHFRDVVSSVIDKHVKQAKQAEKKALNQLMPIYDIWKNTYCQNEKKVFPESFNKIWCNAEELHATKKGRVNYLSDEKTTDAEWRLELYQNFTKFLAPMLPWKNEIEEQPSVDDSNDNGFTLVAERAPENIVSQHDEASLRLQEEKDPLWFSKLFKARESMRKDWGDMPSLSEEEFDWFLKMFEAREQLRKSGTDSYPSEQPINNRDLDWFLKMFEARAQIRFERDAEDGAPENWFLKMAEARKKARCEESEAKDQADWYEKMFDGREKLRGDDDQAEWYHDLAAARKKAREDLSSKAGTDVPADGWCQA